MDRMIKLVYYGNLTEKQAAEIKSISLALDLVEINNKESLKAVMADAEVYIPGPFNNEILKQARKLCWIRYRWAGLDDTLFPEIINSDVLVTNSAGVFNLPIAEHVMAMMLCFSRSIHLAMRWLPKHLGDEETSDKLYASIRELHGATLGIVGYGGVGKTVAQRAKAFGMKVLAIKRNPTGDDGIADDIWGMDKLDEVLRQSDYLLISTALTEETKGMIGEEQLSSMKPDAVIVNIARGAIIDEAALIAKLQNGKLRGAGLDVTLVEPPPADSPLWQMDNVIITPHYSGYSPNTRRRQFMLLCKNLKRYANGEQLLNIVDKKLGY